MARHNQKVKLKRSDLEVTRLSLGTAPLGGLFKAVTDSDGDELLNTALDVGINYFDTAPQYGHGVAEIRLGKALRNAKVPFVVETKVGRVLRHDPNAETFPWFPDAPRDLVPVFDYSPDGIRRAFDESLERMGLDHLDIVLMHDAEEHVKEAIENAFPVLAEYRSQGLIKAVGIGINHAEQALQIMKGTDLDIALIAGRFTLLDQSAQAELYPLALAKKVSIIAAGVFNSGVLANPVEGAYYDYEIAPQEIIDKARAIAKFLEKFNVSLASAALQFPLRHPAVASVLTGAGSTAELRANIASFDATLPDELWSEMEEAGLISSLPN